MTNFVIWDNCDSLSKAKKQLIIIKRNDWEGKNHQTFSLKTLRSSTSADCQQFQRSSTRANSRARRQTFLSGLTVEWFYKSSPSRHSWGPLFCVILSHFFVVNFVCRDSPRTKWIALEQFFPSNLFVLRCHNSGRNRLKSAKKKTATDWKHRIVHDRLLLRFLQEATKLPAQGSNHCRSWRRGARWSRFGSETGEGRRLKSGLL